MKSGFAAEESFRNVGRDARDRRRFRLRRSELENKEIVRHCDLHRKAERRLCAVCAAACQNDGQLDRLGAERRIVGRRFAVGRSEFAVAGGEPAERQLAVGPQFGQLRIVEFEFDRRRTVERERFGAFYDLCPFFDLCLKFGTDGIELFDLFDGRRILGKVGRTLLSGSLVGLVESDSPREHDVAENAERLFIDRVADERFAALDGRDLAGDARQCGCEPLT